MASAAGQYATKAFGHLTSSSNRTMVASTVIVAILTFVTMVTSAYSADHIRKSNCDMGKDGSLKSAYDWSMRTAVISGIATAGMIIMLILVGLGKI
jgi:hypothetical protein